MRVNRGVRALCGFAMVVVLIGASNPALAAGQSGATRVVDFASYLLGMDFVLDGYLLDDVPKQPSGAYSMAIAVTTVLAGTIEDSTMTVVVEMPGAWPAVVPRRGTRVIAWGSWDDTNPMGVSGNFAAVDSRGGITYPKVNMSVPDRPLVVNGRSIVEPGTLERLLDDIARRRDQNPADWIFSGRAIALVRADAVNGFDVSVHLVSWLLGSAEHVPGIVRVRPPGGWGYVPVVGAQLLIPVFPDGPDTLLAPLTDIQDCSPGQRDGWVRVLHARAADLDRVGWRDSSGTHLTRIRRRSPHEP